MPAVRWTGWALVGLIGAFFALVYVLYVVGIVVGLAFAGTGAASYGRQLTERVRREFGYGPLPVQEVLPLLARLRWTVEQVARIEAVA